MFHSSSNCNHACEKNHIKYNHSDSTASGNLIYIAIGDSAMHVPMIVKGEALQEFKYNIKM